MKDEAKYSWDHLTTVCLWDTDLKNFDQNLLCKAHSKGVRIVSVDFLVDPLTPFNNDTFRQEYIANMVANAKKYNLDGVNIDYEGAITKGSPDAALLTLIMKDIQTAFKEIPGSQVTIDVAWAPPCIDVRCYDYVGIAEATDFLVVMDYDEQSQIFGPCQAGATSDYNYLIQGMQGYMTIGIPAFSLLTALPWYGHDFPCLNPTNETVCPLDHRPWRGVNCTDLDCPEYDYNHIMSKMISTSTTGEQWDPLSLSPWFNYIDPQGVHHQVWYDNPASLQDKVIWSKNNKLRGVGMFTAQFLDYKNQTQVDSMWGAMNKFFE